MKKDKLTQDLMEAGYGLREIKAMPRYKKVDEWLMYNGIYGYTNEIIRIVFEAYGADPSDMYDDDDKRALERESQEAWQQAGRDLMEAWEELSYI